MTDGPFRNAELRSPWKRYGQQLVSDAASLEERKTQACHSILGDIDMKVFGSLLTDLKEHTGRRQLDLDPVPTVEAIFERHPMSLMTNVLQRNLLANLREQISPAEPLNQALYSTTTEWIRTAKNRLEEECIRARDRGDMGLDEYYKAVERNRETFGAIETRELCDALLTGDKRAFSRASLKKTGVDDGPE